MVQGLRIRLAMQGTAVGSHTPQGKQASASQRLNPSSRACACPQQERPLRGEALCTTRGRPRTAMESSPCLLQWEKALMWQQRPSTDNNNTLQKKIQCFINFSIYLDFCVLRGYQSFKSGRKFPIASTLALFSKELWDLSIEHTSRHWCKSMWLCIKYKL